MERLTINKVTMMKITQTDKYMKLIEETWEPALRKEMEILENWLHCHEVLVGRTVW